MQSWIMDPTTLGKAYDRLAGWWHGRMQGSQYGIPQLERALKFCSLPGQALDVGCGAGGRMVRLMQQHGLHVTGIDISAAMIKLARENHPGGDFLFGDICTWNTERRFHFIVAWDSIFHLPLAMQEPVVKKMCRMLAAGGVLLYTFGDAEGEHDDVMHGETLHYSSIGIRGNLRALAEAGVSCKHLELDQWPEKHTYVIGVRM